MSQTCIQPTLDFSTTVSFKTRTNTRPGQPGGCLSSLWGMLSHPRKCQQETSKLDAKSLRTKLKQTKYFRQEVQDYKDGSGLQFIKFDILTFYGMPRNQTVMVVEFLIFQSLSYFYLVVLCFQHFWHLSSFYCKITKQSYNKFPVALIK